MFTTQSLALALGVLLLFLLHRFLPNRKAFFLFVLMLAAAGVFAWLHPWETPTTTSPEARAHLAQQQTIVSDWFKDYQGLVEQLDHNWQQYHRILSDFDEDIIGIEAAYARLRQLEPQAARVAATFDQMDPPIELDDASYDIVTAMIFKTRAYANARLRTIQRTAAAADPEHLLSNLQEEQSRHLRDVMITESPAGLFTAEDIKALRESVALPE